MEGDDDVFGGEFVAPQLWRMRDMPTFSFGDGAQ